MTSSAVVYFLGSCFSKVGYRGGDFDSEAFVFLINLKKVCIDQDSVIGRGVVSFGLRVASTNCNQALPFIW